MNRFQGFTAALVLLTATAANTLIGFLYGDEFMCLGTGRIRCPVRARRTPTREGGYTYWLLANQVEHYMGPGPYPWPTVRLWGARFVNWRDIHANQILIEDRICAKYGCSHAVHPGFPSQVRGQA